MIMMEMVSCLYLCLFLFVFVFAFVFPARVLPAQHYLAAIDDEEHTGDGEDDVDDGENECTDCAKSSYDGHQCDLSDICPSLSLYSEYCGFCSNRILPYFPLSVSLEVIGIDLQ